MKILGLDITRATNAPEKRTSWVWDETFWSDIIPRSYAGVTVNEQTALRMSAVWACVQVLAQGVASLPLILYRREGDSKERAQAHPLYTILHDRPNANMTWYQFAHAMMVQTTLRGNGYAEIQRTKSGVVAALWPLPGEDYEIKPTVGETGAVSYRVKRLKDRAEYTIPADRMFHVMGFTKDGITGVSTIEAARQGIGLGLAAEEYGARFFGDGANPGGVLKHPAKLTEETANRLRRQWDDKYKGVDKSHNTVVLEEGMEYQQVTISPRDAAWLEGRQFQITDICRIFRVPPHMVAQLDRATWANIEHMGQEFVTYTLQPWLTNWEQTIKWKLLGERDRESYFAEFLIEGLLRGDTTSRYAAYATARQNGWMSANDIRIRENMDPIEGGDVYLVPLNMVPADQAGGMRTEPAVAPRDIIVNVENREVPPVIAPEPVTEERADSGQGPRARQRLARAYLPVFGDALLRMWHRERDDVMRAARKRHILTREFEEWLEQYYAQRPDYATKLMKPALSSYGTAIAGTAIDETGGSVTDPEQFVEDYAVSFGKRESIDSRMRVMGAVHRAEADQRDRVDVLAEEFESWEEGRLAQDSGNETNRAGNAIAKVLFVAAGIQVLRWVAMPTACPYCLRMNGKVVSVTSHFLPAGGSAEGDEGSTPITTERDLGHPPLHTGCECMVAPG